MPCAATCGGGASDEEEGGHARGPEEARCACVPLLVWQDDALKM